MMLVNVLIMINHSVMGFYYYYYLIFAISEQIKQSEQ